MFNSTPKSILVLVAIAIVSGFIGGYVANNASTAPALFVGADKNNNLDLKTSAAPLAVPKASLAQEEAVINIVKKYSPAVVSVIVSKDVPVLEKCSVSPFGNDPFFKQFFGDIQIQPQCQKGTKLKEVGGGISEELRNIIQTDAAINSGNSGGPLLNLKGEVIGVNVAMAQDAQGISFALPINEAKKAVQGVKSQGKIVYPFLGIKFATITESVQKANNLPVSEGAWLKASNGESSIVKDSPADKAGLKAGNIITEVNGEKLTTKNLLSDVIQKFNVGETINLKVLRGEQTITIPVKLEERKF